MNTVKYYLMSKNYCGEERFASCIAFEKGGFACFFTKKGDVWDSLEEAAAEFEKADYINLATVKVHKKMDTLCLKNLFLREIDKHWDKNGSLVIDELDHSIDEVSPKLAKMISAYCEE